MVTEMWNSKRSLEHNVIIGSLLEHMYAEEQHCLQS